MHLHSFEKSQAVPLRTVKYFWRYSVEYSVEAFCNAQYYFWFVCFTHTLDTSDQHAADARANTPLTWHDGVSDVEVIERQPQWLTRGGRGRAGGLRGWPGRLDGRGGWRGVTAGLETIVLRFQRLDLILFIDERMKMRQNLIETAFKTVVIQSNSLLKQQKVIFLHLGWPLLLFWISVIGIMGCKRLFDLQGSLCIEG